LTHISRGIDSMPAVFVNGSIVSTIIVSERGAPSPASQSRKSRPIMRTLIRLAPSQVGYMVSCGMLGSEVGVDPATKELSTKVGDSRAWTGSLPQVLGGRPGKEVSRQQMTSPCVKRKAPIARTIAIPQKRTARMGNHFDNISILTTLCIVSLFQKGQAENPEAGCPPPAGYNRPNFEPQAGFS